MLRDHSSKIQPRLRGCGRKADPAHFRQGWLRVRELVGDRAAAPADLRKGGSMFVGTQIRAARGPVSYTHLPPRWLRNRHLQSILPSLPARRRWVMPRTAALRAASQEILLDCGDSVRLQCFHADPARCGITRVGRVAVLVHGWEGNAEALYILSLAQQLFDRGFDVVRLNLRDHGDTHHLNRELFHSCLLYTSRCV